MTQTKVVSKNLQALDIDVNIVHNKVEWWKDIYKGL